MTATLPTATRTSLTAPSFVRGETVTDALVPFAEFTAPDARPLLDRLTLGDPGRMADLHALSTADVIDFLAAVGDRLHVDRNDLLAEALDNADRTCDLTAPVLRATYDQLAGLYARETVAAVADEIGRDVLDGWVEHPSGSVRAFGTRTAHIIAGNNPIIAAITLVRAAVTRCDALVKSPANDPFTAVAIARTMAEIDPDHPLVRHLAVAYWKGGDESVERALYHPSRLQKIVAWGGFASVTHVTRYLRPGLELVTLDPKLSATVVGPEAFADPDAADHSSALAAVDVGALNQDGCFNARVIYVLTGTDAAGIRRAQEWAARLHGHVQALPERASTPVRRFDAELRAELAALRLTPDYYDVLGGRDGEGAVVVSLAGEPVDFSDSLSGRVANIVPIDRPDQAVAAMNAYTQTVGVYPDTLKRQLRDIAPRYGVQRLVSLGYATHFQPDLPQDGTEPVRRMLAWIVDETHRPEAEHPLGHLCPEVITP